MNAKSLILNLRESAVGSWKILQKLLKEVSDFASLVWERFIELFFKLLPTTEGSLDDELVDVVKNTLLFLGVRFRTYNKTVGNLFSFGVFLSLIGILGGLVVVSLAPSTAEGVISYVLLTLYIILAITVVVALCLIFLGDIVLSLYILSLIWYGIQRMRTDLLRKSREKENKVRVAYSCAVAKEEENESIRIQKENLVAVSRIIIYLFILLLFLLFYWFSTPIFETIKSAVNKIPMNKAVGSSSFSLVESIISGIDALLDIDLLFLLRPEGLEFVQISIFSIIVFSLFLNWKQIAQNAEISKFEWTDQDAFTWWGEFMDCLVVIEIIFYHLIFDEMQNEFSQIRGEIVGAFLITTTGVLFSYFWVLVILENMA